MSGTKVGEPLVWKDGDSFYDHGYDDENAPDLNNRIEFPQNELYGRDEELQVLSEHFQSCSGPDVDAPVVIVSGYSGSGKSALVDHFMQRLESEQDVNFLYLKGKYESFPSPFSAIIQAFTGFCNHILQPSKSVTLQRIQLAIEESLGDQARVLVPVVPALGSILDGSNDTDFQKGIDPNPDESTHSIAKSDGAWNQLRFLFQTLLRAIGNEACPVLMFLDNLQWCDSASIGLLQALLNDKSLNNFMFVGALCENEVDRDHLISKLLEKMGKNGKVVHRISLRPLTLDEVGEFISDTLSLSVEECVPFTEAVFNKTRGNIFHTRHAIEELHRSNALYYSVIAFRWEWNLKDLATGFSDTLEESVLSKIKRAPQLLQTALLLAAYTRSTINIAMLHTLIVAYTEEPLNLKELEKLLETAVIEGLLLNSVGSSDYRFAHDRIQQAAYKLIPSGPEQNKLRLFIGKKMFELASSSPSSNGTSDDWNIFVAADHLNSLINTEEEIDTMTLIKLNFTCGEKAVAVAAYAPACVYLRLALKFLRRFKDNVWTKHYDIALRVYQTTSDVDLCLGHFDDGNELAQEVLANARNAEDKVTTWMSLSGALGRLRRHAEAKDLCKRALTEISDTPKRFHNLHFVKYDFQVKQYLKRHSDVDILCLPKLEDEKRMAELVMLNECGLRGLAGGDMMEYLFCTARQLIISFEFGLCSLVAQPLSTYAMVFNMAGDYKSATRMARLARSILKETTKTKEVTPYTILMTCLHVEGWTQPREQVLLSLNEAQRIGMQNGNFEYGFLLWSCTVGFLLTVGYHLETIATTAVELLEQSHLYSVDAIYSMTEQHIVLIQCLREGDGPNWQKLESFRFEIDPTDGDQTWRFVSGIVARLDIAVIFGNLDLASAMVNDLEPFLPLCAMYTVKPMQLFLSCLTFAGLARSVNRRRNLAQARKYSKEIKKLVGTQGTHIIHKYMLMDAAILWADPRGNVTKVAKAFEEGIAHAEDISYLQDVALGSELAGEFFISIGDNDRARDYLQKALDFYDEWGAVAKARALMRDRAEYVAAEADFNSMPSSMQPGRRRSSRKSFIDAPLPLTSTPVLEVPVVPESIRETSPMPDSNPCKERKSTQELSELTWDQTASFSVS